MKPGDYVRYKDFNDIDVIARVIKIKNTKPDNDIVYYLDNDDFICYDGSSDTFLDDVICSAKYIIDLIQVGDYVNGKLVIDTFTDYIFDYSEEFKVIRFSETDILHDVKHIESIVTKEQFESISYKVGR